jgi:hypothetical protein
MSWVWNTANDEKRAWILGHTEKAGFRWTPPPPLPAGQPSARAGEAVDDEARPS